MTPFNITVRNTQHNNGNFVYDHKHINSPKFILTLRRLMSILIPNINFQVYKTICFDIIQSCVLEETLFRLVSCLEYTSLHLSILVDCIPVSI